MPTNSLWSQPRPCRRPGGLWPRPGARLRVVQRLCGAGAIGLLTLLVCAPPGVQRAGPAPGGLPQRIVSLNLAADEIVLALAPLERLTALTYLADDPTFSNVAPQARLVPQKVRANAEQVMALRPDLLLVATYTSATVKRLLRESGVPYLELPQFKSVAGIQENILAVGQAVGAAETAQAIVATMRQRLAQVQQRVARLPAPRVLYYAGGGFTAGQHTTIGEMLTLAGGDNVALEAGVQGMKKLPPELLVWLNPAVIVVGGTPGKPGLREGLLADPTLHTVAAVRTGRIVVLPRPFLNTLSQHIVTGVEALAQALHPAAFASQDEPGGGAYAE